MRVPIQQEIDQHPLTGVGHDLVETVETIVADHIAGSDEAGGIDLPERIELFCVESLFRIHPKTNQTGVDRATAQLQRLSRTKKRAGAALAWGNTNTRPREYKVALGAAAKSGRPVHFVVYDIGGCLTSRLTPGPDKLPSDLYRQHVLPEVTFTDLLCRDVFRLVKTGKYVPARAVWESSSRVQSLVDNVLRDLDRASGIGGTITKKEPPAVGTTRKTTSDGSDKSTDENKDDHRRNTDKAAAQAVHFHSKADFDRRLAELVGYPVSSTNESAGSLIGRTSVAKTRHQAR